MMQWTLANAANFARDQAPSFTCCIRTRDRSSPYFAHAPASGMCPERHPCLSLGLATPQFLGDVVPNYRSSQWAAE
ncbi:MAG: hypothetical protein ACI8W8_001381 [Rhodothermales bacterium]|jgi:hypothetical protein